MMSSTGWVAVIEGTCTVDCCLLTTLSSIEECFFYASSREVYNNVAVVGSINGGGECWCTWECWWAGEMGTKHLTIGGGQ
jgi:hypothetical protein